MPASDQLASSRVKGLDSLRFVCALWVLIGHAGGGPFSYAMSIDKSTVAGLVARGVLNNLVSGPAAVIVFFVISGFCVHFPYRQAASVDLVPYFARRHIRILLPVAAAVLLGGIFGVQLPLLQDSILWSLVCEEVYYTVYPLILRAKFRLGWPVLITISFVGAYLVVLTNPQAADYPSYGPFLNWALGLPCWLLGCHLADRWDDLSQAAPPGSRSLWGWRVGVLMTSMFLSGLRFHSEITYPWTLDVFALVAVWWLGKEALYWRHHQPARLLEFGGLFSYSIYLTHLHGLALYRQLGVGVHVPEILSWPGQLVFVLVFCLCFYLAVERPAHQLARLAYGALMGRRNRRVLTGIERGLVAMKRSA